MRSKRIGNILSRVFIAVCLIVALFPIYWMFCTSLKSEGEIYAKIPTLVPDKVTFEAYTYLLSSTNFLNALKNSLIPVITYFGPMLAFIVTGSMVVENIFAVPGIGREFISSITDRDYTMILGTTIFLASLIVIMNLVSDLLYKVVDPRIEFD